MSGIVSPLFCGNTMTTPCLGGHNGRQITSSRRSLSCRRTSSSSTILHLCADGGEGEELRGTVVHCHHKNRRHLHAICGRLPPFRSDQLFPALCEETEEKRAAACVSIDAFWVRLRGAVSVALEAGFQGTNTQVLRTTVLVLAVLTVLMFGGTTARMLEVLQIRTGVEDEGASSDEEDECMLPGAGGRSSCLYNNASRCSNGGGGKWGSYAYADDDPAARGDSAAARIRTHYGLSSYNHHTPTTSPLNNGAIFSAASPSDSDSDAGEVLPMASTSPTTAAGAPLTIDAPGSSGDAGASPTPVTATAEDGKWFQALDERYLLPLFSNATASRTFHARRARRTASSQHHLRGTRTGIRAGSLSVTSAESDAEDDIGGEVELRAGSGSGNVGIGGNGGPAMLGGVGLAGRRDSVPIGFGT